MKMKFISALILAVTLALLVTLIPAMAFFNSTTFIGRGLVADGSGHYHLQTEVCGAFNGAETEDPYLLWILDAPDARNADISGPWGSTTMTRTGEGSFVFVSGWYDPDSLNAATVKATYDGHTRNATLLIGHGCPPVH